MRKSFSIALAIAHFLSLSTPDGLIIIKPDKPINDPHQISTFVKKIESSIEGATNILEAKSVKRGEIKKNLLQSTLIEEASGNASGITTFKLKNQYLTQFVGINNFNLGVEIRGNEAIAGDEKRTLNKSLESFIDALSKTKDYYEFQHPNFDVQTAIRSNIKTLNHPDVKNKELQIFLKELFQQQDKFPGGTAGVLYVEKVRPVWGEKTHLEKAKNAYAYLQRFALKAEVQEPKDRKVVHNLKNDLLTAIHLFEPNFSPEEPSKPKQQRLGSPNQKNASDANEPQRRPKNKKGH